MSVSKKTFVQKKIEWLENHKIWGWIILFTVIVGILGGVVSSVKTTLDLYAMLFKKDENEIRITLSLQNQSSITVGVDPICHFDVVESDGGSERSYTGLGDMLRLMPITTTATTNGFILKPNESHDYIAHLPNNQLSRDLMDRGATVIRIYISTSLGNRVETAIPLLKDELQKTIVKIGQ